MKTHKIILAFFTLCTVAVIINACSTNDLELVNPNELSPETFFKTDAQIESAVNAVYANLQTTGMYTRLYFFSHDLMSDDAGGNPQLEADKKEFLQFSFDSNQGSGIADYWESCYRGINKCNFVLGNAEKINAAPIAQARKDKFFGEAKFMRALYNFYLVIKFGDMPLITDIPTTTDGIGKSPKADVYALIISDLKSAQTTLKTKATEQVGRATSEAATALLGKVYLYLEQYDLALTEFVKLNGKFTLTPEFYDNFKDETEHGPESIFEVEYDAVISSNPWVSGVSGAGTGEAGLRGQEYGFNDWFNTYPTDDLLAEYEAGDGRFADTFYVAGDMFGGTGGRAVEVADLTVPGFVRAAGWKKYQNYYKRLNENSASSINFKYMRYADVLLMMAECENKRPGGSQDAAIGYINQVRARPSTGLAALPLGQAAPAVFNAIVHERRVELAGEQLRYNDLIRWGMAATKLASKGFNSPKNLLWPIPEREISSNDAITSADQNPGY